MTPQRMVSKRTFYNWLLDATLALSGLWAAISGIYFLFLPSGGYKGGRNPFYGIVILFERATWEDLHLWTGLGMIVVAIIHLAIHWKWVVSTTRRLWREITRQTIWANSKVHWNILVNSLVAIGFFLSAISGLYFFFAGSSHGGLTPDPMFIFTRSVWDLVHTWSSVVMIGAAMVHFAIHWQWVVKVTRRIANQIKFNPVQVVPVAEQS